MVSGFMHNLMARHQDSGAEVGAAQFVQPRPCARFETDPVPSMFSGRNNHISESPEYDSFTHDEAAPLSAVPPRQRISSPSALNSVLPVSSSPIASFHQESVPTERDSVQLNPQPQVTVSRHTGTETSVPDWGHRLRTPQQQRQLGEHAPQIQAEQQHIQIIEQRTEQQQRGSHTADSDIRIEKILHRLNMQQPKEYSAPTGKDMPTQFELNESLTDASAGKRTEQPKMRIIERQIEQQTSLGADTVNGRIEEILQRLTAKPKESPVMPSNQSAFSERITAIEQAQAPLYSPEVKPALPEYKPLRQASSLAPSPAGLLELPGWLNGLQADLQSRWQEAAPQMQPEPVINVTIGRIEVRAMQQAKAESRPAARPQPSSVMSLDEYLKQREHRRG